MCRGNPRQNLGHKGIVGRTGYDVFRPGVNHGSRVNGNAHDSGNFLHHISHRHGPFLKGCSGGVRLPGFSHKVPAGKGNNIPSLPFGHTKMPLFYPIRDGGPVFRGQAAARNHRGGFRDFNPEFLSDAQGQCAGTAAAKGRLIHEGLSQTRGPLQIRARILYPVNQEFVFGFMGAGKQGLPIIRPGLHYTISSLTEITVNDTLSIKRPLFVNCSIAALMEVL